MINDIANTKLVDLPYTKRLENVISEFENVKSSPSKFCVPLFLTVLTSIIYQASANYLWKWTQSLMG